jgi:hypothetical protein
MRLPGAISTSNTTQLLYVAPGNRIAWYSPYYYNGTPLFLLRGFEHFIYPHLSRTPLLARADALFSLKADHLPGRLRGVQQFFERCKNHLYILAVLHDLLFQLFQLQQYVFMR